MPSPLPGMDPYLDEAALWPIFHRHLAAAVYQMLLPGLVDRYRARVASRSYTSDLVLFTSVTKEHYQEEFLEIRSRTDGGLVTLVDFVSVGNRTTQAGRAAFLATRAACQADRAAFVEIDLLTQGKPPVDLDRSTVPPHDGSVTVTRGTAPDRHEIYVLTFKKRLPKFKVPLAPDDRDTVLDLQLAYSRAYESGRFETRIDYAKAIPVDAKVGDEDREWMGQLLRPTSKG